MNTSTISYNIRKYLMHRCTCTPIPTSYNGIKLFTMQQMNIMNVFFRYLRKACSLQNIFQSVIQKQWLTFYLSIYFFNFMNFILLILKTNENLNLYFLLLSFFLFLFKNVPYFEIIMFFNPLSHVFSFRKKLPNIVLHWSDLPNLKVAD